jgi:sarcosine oxidase subunit beta
VAETADVVVVGAGVVGASVAFHLAGRTKRIVVCERRFPAAGATGKSGALVRMHYTNEPEARLAIASFPYFQHWADLVKHGSSGFVNTGMLRLVGREHEDGLRANVTMLQRLGARTTLITGDQLRSLVPAWRTDDIAWAAHEPESGVADPVATTYGFLRAAQALGADVRIGSEVTGVRMARGRVEGVDTSGGPIASRAVVIAGGAWALPLLRTLGIQLELRTVRIQVAVFRRPTELEAPHPVCIDGTNYMWLRPEGPEFASTLVGIGQRQALPDPDGLDDGVDADYVERTKVRLAHRIPPLANAPMRGGWAGAITLTADGKPIIDRHPDADGVWFCTGDNGTSFKTAPAVGRAVAEWITDGAPSLVPLAPFRASRYREGAPIVGQFEYGDHPTEMSGPVMVG